MFTVLCHAHGTRVLLDTSRIEAIHNTEHGPIVSWHCWCGARGHLFPGGRSVARRDPTPLVAA
ncbi:MAG TPA: hypothetical protein VFB77_03205 [Acidimicrobiales bacterium]|nr:hypothetical protein [Acidimicrobiales bacterium]